MNITPGIWVASENGGDDADARKLYICAKDRYGDMTMIARVDDDLDMFDKGDPESNARLIAHAPLMLGYVERRATEGDTYAKSILAALQETL